MYHTVCMYSAVPFFFRKKIEAKKENKTLSWDTHLWLVNYIDQSLRC